VRDEVRTDLLINIGLTLASDKVPNVKIALLRMLFVSLPNTIDRWKALGEDEESSLPGDMIGENSSSGGGEGRRMNSNDSSLILRRVEMVVDDLVGSEDVDVRFGAEEVVVMIRKMKNGEFIPPFDGNR